MLRTIWTIAVCLLAITATAEAQQGPMGPARGRGELPIGRGGRLGMPPRDNAAAPTGTSKISGRVVSAETGTPIRRAQINVNSREARVGRNVATDGDGRYEITGLPAGRYRLTVNKAGYVPLEYGQARPFEAGKPLDLANGQALERIDFSLPRGSAITGRIVDEYGDPVTDVQVQALRYQFVNGQRQLVNVGRTARTDDLGSYRIFGLMPGDYIVQASLRDGPQQPRENSAEQTGYPGTYYPGVAEAAQAQTVTVALGQEVSSIAFSLVPARLSRVSGTVVGSAGHPLAGAVLMIRPKLGGVAAAANLLGANSRTQAAPDGTFRLIGIPPGEYVLEVQERPQRQQDPPATPAPLEFASVGVSVSGDVDGLLITTTTGVSLTGRVIYEGGTAPRGTLQVMAVGIDGLPPQRNMTGRGVGNARVAANGTFELSGIAGPVLLRVQGTPADWALKSITLNGEDITDTPSDFKGGTGTVVITLTNRLTEVTGAVRNSRGEPESDYVLVAFPQDPRLWVPQSRHVQTTRPNQNGTFSIKGLPPGRYFAAIVPSLENGAQNDPALLDQLRRTADMFSLADGETLTLNLGSASLRGQ